MSELGKQLKTIEAKIVNGFLIKSSDRAIKIKNIVDIVMSGCQRSVYFYIGFDEEIKINVIGEPSLEEIILELGVDL